jgi:tripartite-type tricarboxylate transporter receptor subunit TctC
MKKRFIQVAVCITVGLTTLFAAAADYPNKPIKLIVPFAPGGGSDVVARLLAEKMAPELGVSIVVENKAGASSIIGTDAVYKAASDGYTLLLANSAITSNPWLYKLPYDTSKLTAITMIASAPQLLAAHPSAPFKTFKEMIAYAKANPKKVTVATAGGGQLSHLAAEILEKSAKIELTTIHYKGSGNALADLLGGHINMSFGTAPGLIPHIKNGKLVAIAASGTTRIPVLPDVPTIGETLPGYDLVNWFGIFAPPETPKPVIDKVYHAVSSALGHPAIAEKLAADGFEPKGLRPEKFDQLFHTELAYWKKFVQENNLKID